MQAQSIQQKIQMEPLQQLAIDADGIKVTPKKGKVSPVLTVPDDFGIAPETMTELDMAAEPSIGISATGIDIETGYGPIADYAMLAAILVLLGGAYYIKKRIDLVFAKKAKADD